MTRDQHVLRDVDGRWNNTGAWPEISSKLFLDHQDRAHLSVSDA